MCEQDFDTAIIDSWVSLAAAICNSGIKEHDTRFLSSEWYEELTDAVSVWDRVKHSNKKIN